MTSDPATADADMLRDMERRRLRSLVQVDLVVAEVLHADDYQLITPNGYALSKRGYLGAIASGELRYQVFEPASEIRVRTGGSIALLRYQADITVQSSGGPFVDIQCWHTDSYELREGHWRAVWSQATRITPAAEADQPAAKVA
ncbi:MAG: nuclear transport factor 2 family protein [Streptosporangiaceae bacterium]